MTRELVTTCPVHMMSASGAEGPIATLGRFPVIWRCDNCGGLEVGV